MESNSLHCEPNYKSGELLVQLAKNNVFYSQDSGSRIEYDGLIRNGRVIEEKMTSK